MDEDGRDLSTSRERMGGGSYKEAIDTTNERGDVYLMLTNELKQVQNKYKTLYFSSKLLK